jgi:hypothetical protein
MTRVAPESGLALDRLHHHFLDNRPDHDPGIPAGLYRRTVLTVWQAIPTDWQVTQTA